MTVLGQDAGTMDWMVIATAIGLVITTLAGGMVTVIMAFGKMRAEQLKVLRDMSDKSDKITSKADEIHDLVNGSAHAATAKLSDLEQQITSLHERIATLQEQRVQDAKSGP